MLWVGSVDQLFFLVVFSYLFVCLVIFDWIPNVNFTMLDVWYFCIPGHFLNYLEIVLFLQVLLHRVRLGSGTSALFSRANYSSLYWRMTLLTTLFRCPMNSSPSCVNLRYGNLLPFWQVLSWAPNSFLIYFSEYLRGTLWRSPDFSPLLGTVVLQGPAALVSPDSALSP